MVRSIGIWVGLNCLMLVLISHAFAGVSGHSLQKGAMMTIKDTHLPFIANQGQLDNPAVGYYADTFACRLMVTPSGRMVYDAPGRPQKSPNISKLMGERLINAAPIAVRGENPRTTQYHIFDGPKEKDWHRNIAGYHALTMGKVYQGIELKLAYHDRNVEKLFYIDPGANPDQIRLAVDNVERLAVNHKGELVLGKPSGDLHFSRPVAYQLEDQKRQPVSVDYHVQGSTYGFKLGSYDRSKKLIIDPLVNSYSIESRNVKSALMAMAKDGDGNVYAAGISNDEFVVYKFDPQITEITTFVQFCHSRSLRITVLSDLVTGMALDSQNNVFVVGTTKSDNFPVTEGCLDQKTDSVLDQEGFIIKFDADLKGIIAATHLGGDSKDMITGIAIDKQDHVYVAGYTVNSPGDDAKFPIADIGFDISPGIPVRQKGFISKLSNDLTTLMASTFVGGHQGGVETDDTIGCLALDGSGSVYVGGATMSDDFPVLGGADVEFTGKSEAFVARFNSGLTILEASTFLGGMNVEDSDEQVKALVIDRNNPPAVYVGGWTNSTDFPMPQGYDTDHNREEDGFIAKLSMDLSNIDSATFLGGDSKDEVFCMALAPLDDGTDALIVGGVTESGNFPVTQGCHDDRFKGTKYPMGGSGRRPHDDNDGFISIFDRELKTLIASSLLGGERTEFIDAIMINGNDILISGQSGSKEDFLPLAPKSSSDFMERGFIARFSGNINSGEDGNHNIDETGKGDDKSGDDKIDEGKSSGGGGGGGGCFITGLTF